MAVKIPKPEPTQRPRKRPRMDTQTVSEIINLDDDSELLPKTTRRSRLGATEATAISVEQYCRERDLRRPTMAFRNFIDLVGDGDDSDLQVLCFNTPKRRPIFSGPSVTELGQSSNSKPSDPNPNPNPNPNPTFVCEICADEKPAGESFAVKGCDHAYCAACTATYVASKLQDNVTAIACPAPGCGAGALEPEHCRAILPPEVFERWGFALCEALVLASEKFLYCPYRDCSAMLIDDGGAAVTESSCPNCHRMFCAQCGVAWHAGVGCEEFRRLRKDEREAEDLMLLKLAQSKRWRRCPNCRFYVERTAGCLFIKCRSVYTLHFTHTY